MLEVRYKGHKILVYAFATNQFKPYVRELYTLRGENVTRDAPPDHLHHHGLMYAVYVNGINFWEERGAPGVERHVELPLKVATIGPNGLPMASFTELIQWLSPSNQPASDPLAAALLSERRTLTVTVDEKNQEVALRWDSEFQVGPNAGKVTITVRTMTGWASGCRSRSTTSPGSRTPPVCLTRPRTPTNVTTARWTSVSGQMDGRDVMLVMFGRPDNARGDAAFFTMLDPFAYLSATQAPGQAAAGICRRRQVQPELLAHGLFGEQVSRVYPAAAANAGRKNEVISPHGRSMTTATPALHTLHSCPTLHSSYEQDPHWH